MEKLISNLLERFNIVGVEMTIYTGLCAVSVLALLYLIYCAFGKKHGIYAVMYKLHRIIYTIQSYFDTEGHIILQEDDIDETIRHFHQDLKAIQSIAIIIVDDIDKFFASRDQRIREQLLDDLHAHILVAEKLVIKINAKSD